MLKIKILTLFPEYFTSFLSNSIIARAISKNVVSFELINIRNFTKDKNHRVDDCPIGGGAGLIMKMQPLVDALNSTKNDSSYILLTSPLGKTFNQEKAIELSKKEEIIIVCGHYEGTDYRFNKYVDELVSIGDFITTGGEVAAISISDAVTRLLDGAITHDSIVEESFNDNTLEYPQYTFPYDYNGDKVPDILFTGNHEAISIFRRRESLRLTKNLRPDLFNKLTLSKQDLKRIEEIENNTISKKEQQALIKGEKFIKNK